MRENKRQTSKDISYSQNFLVNESLVESLVANSAIYSTDTVVEIGPGKGIITKFLAEKLVGGRLFLVEIDLDLANTLRARFDSYKNIKLFSMDIRDFKWNLGSPVKVFSNIPFNLSSDILNVILSPLNPVTEGYIVLQKEVAEMYAGRGIGASFDTLKSYLAAPFFHFTLEYKFQKRDFFPIPNVDIVLLHFVARNSPLIPIEKYSLYNDFLVYVSSDRFGEGAWTKVFTKKQMGILASREGLVLGRGLKQQQVQGILNAFGVFDLYSRDKHYLVKGAAKHHSVIQNGLKKINRTRLDYRWKNSQN